MSLRTVDRTLDQRVAALEDFVRHLQSTTAVRPTDTRYLYSAAGDILVAVAAANPQPLAAGALGDVLTVTAGGLPAWRDPDRIRQSIIGDKGWIIVGASPGVAMSIPPGADGTVLTADSTVVPGVRWV